MKRHLLFSGLLLLMGISTASATDTLTCPYKDGFMGEVAVDGSLLYYDNGGDSGNTKGYTENYYLFKPANEGDVLTIDFQSPINFTNSNTHIYIYDGNCGFGGWGSSVPEGYLADLQDGDTYTYSTSSSISVLYYAPKSDSGTGWEALLTTAPSKDMEWSSISATQDLGGYCYPSRNDVAIIRADLLTDGGSNPFTASNIKFNLQGTTSLSDLSNIRCLYSGSSTSIASATQFGDTYDTATEALEFVGSQALKSGHNYFWLVADIASDATAGNVIDASLTSATVAGVERVDDTIAPDGSRTIDNMLFMASGTNSYNIGELPLKFYDDGGPEAAYTKEFSGTTTFYPSVDGKKVKINFTKLDLFNTSSAISVGNNDVIKVYSGSEANDANLLATIIQNDPIEVSSVADNGAITVVFTSKTGYPTSGFEAEVSLFEPQAMEVSYVIAEAVSTETVSAGDTNQAMLLFNLKTVNTEPAATANNFKFNYSGTENAANKATLYYIGADKTATTGTKVGEATVASQFTITGENAVELAQKDNYFRLSYDISENAQTSDTVGAELVTVVSNGEEYEPEDPVKATRTVNNICYAEGTKTITVNGDWTFKNKPSEYSYYAYDALSGNQTVTFIPGVDGQVVEMAFSKLSIAWPSYSTGSDPVFNIYSGTEVNADNLLYSVTKATKDVVPQGTIRSNDGALTVVFNANGTKGSYSSNGFEALVSLYQPKDMTVTSVDVLQASTDVVTPASTDNEILKVKVVTEGNLEPKQLQSMVVDLKGSAKYVKGVKLYATGLTETFSTDNLLASADVDAEQTSATLTLEEPYSLLEGTSYLWVAYDMQESLVSDEAIDAAITKFTVSNADVALATADPDGARLTKNIYYFQNGDNVVTVDDSLLFYDNGGADGNYTTDAKGTVTFKPTEGKIIKFTFNDFYTNVNDDFYIYNGTSTDSNDQLAKYYSSKTGLADIISTADDGALTVKFNPTKNNTNRGWEILVSAFVPAPIEVSNVAVAADVAPAKLLLGSGNNPMLKMAVTLEGERGTMNITQFNFDTLDTDASALTNAKVWYTGTEATFAATDLYGEATATSPLAVAGDLTLKTAGTYYFWLTYDVNPEANIGDKLEAKLTNITVNDAEVLANNDTEYRGAIQSGFHGTYTIGTSSTANYATFADAVAAMADGIDGPVVFEVESGSYVEKIVLPAVTGSSELNTITFRSKSGNAEDVVVSHETCDTSYGAAKDGVLKFNGINYATVENMTFTTENTSFESVVLLLNQSRHNTLSGCRVIAPATSSSSTVNLVKTYAESTANANNDYFTVENCYLEGGYIGVSINGTSTVSPVKFRGEESPRILNNTLVNQGSKAIYLSSCWNATIDGNTITNDGAVLSSTQYVMDLYRAAGEVVVSNNKVNVNAGTSCAMYGIYLRDLNNDYADESHKLIYNNDIQVVGGDGSSKEISGIKIWINKEGKHTMEVMNNTVVLRGSGSSVSSPFFIYDSFVGCKAYNNIFQNETSVGYAVRVQKATYINETSEFKNNALYAASGTIGYVAEDVKEYADFAEKVGETDGVNEKAEFLTDDNHELAQAGNLVAALPVDYITKDILGRDRDASTPTIGAYEFVESVNAPAMVEGYPTITAVKHDSAVLNLAADMACVAQYVILDASADQPSLEEVAASEDVVELASATPVAVALSGLTHDTTYKAYIVLTSYTGNVSDVISSEAFTTSYQPTAVSTFENVTVTDEGFEDGTAAFSGFEVVEATDAPGVDSQKVAKISDGEAIVTLTNSTNLTIDGCFISNDAPVTLTAYNEEYEITATKTVAAGAWRFINLRDLGAFTTLGFSTEGEAMIDDFAGQPNEFEVAISEYPVNATSGQTSHLEAYVAGGVADYNITWTSAAGEVISRALSFDYEFEHSTKVYLNVTDAWGNTGSDKADIVVKGDQYVATFEDLKLDPESYWNGDEDGQSSFYSGSFEFSNYYMKSWNSWAFFGYSNCTSTNFTSYMTDQMYSAVGSGAQGSDTYGVAYVSSYYGNTEVTLSNTTEGQVIPGVWLTNSAWAKDAILNGDGMSTVAGGFTTGDYFKLVITGHKADGTTSSIDCYLADYRNEDVKEHYLLDTWQWFDLSSLGAVTSLTFDMQSTKTNSYGITTPTYFCLDNLGGDKEVIVADAITVESKKWSMGKIDAKDYFDFDPEEASITYDIDLDSSYASIDENGIIAFPWVEPRSFDVTIHASQKGKHSYVKVPVTVVENTGVETTVAQGLSIYPVPAHDVLNISTDMSDYNVALYSLNGALMLSQSHCDGNATISLDGVAAGMYLIRISNDNSVYTQQIIVK